MNYYQYNTACIFTSILMLLLIIIKYKEINLCLILILASIFSILWRCTKVYMGDEKINKDKNGNFSSNNQLSHPLFLLDLLFALLAFICVLYSNQINKKFIFIVIFLFIIVWGIHFTDLDVETSNTLHFLAHCYILLIIFITFYLYIQ